MGRAEELWERAQRERVAFIQGLIEIAAAEDLFVDFKRSADNGVGRLLHGNDRSHLRRAISGFGNSEGGLIIWGVDCRPSGGDVAAYTVPLADPIRFAALLDAAVGGATIPIHRAVRNLAIASDVGSGFVVTLIPASDAAPLQCVDPVRYFIRAGSEFREAPHAVLAGLFGRPPRVRLENPRWIVRNFELVPPASPAAVRLRLALELRSAGPGLARDVYASLNAESGQGVAIHVSGPDLPGDFAPSPIFPAPPADQRDWVVHGESPNISVVFAEGVRLAPRARVRPITMSLVISPPCGSLTLEVAYGHASSPPHEMTVAIIGETLDMAVREAIADGWSVDVGLRLVRTILQPNEEVAWQATPGPAPITGESRAHLVAALRSEDIDERKSAIRDLRMLLDSKSIGNDTEIMEELVAAAKEGDETLALEALSLIRDIERRDGAGPWSEEFRKWALERCREPVSPKLAPRLIAWLEVRPNATTDLDVLAWIVQQWTEATYQDGQVGEWVRSLQRAGHYAQVRAFLADLLKWSPSSRTYERAKILRDSLGPSGA